MHTVAACLIVKNEAPYLLEWVAYHRVIGVEFFYIYDNESTDGTAQILASLQRAGIIEVISWPTIPGHSPQVMAYNDACKRFNQESEWLAFIDADEFILPHADGAVRDFLAKYPEDVGAVGINWKVFGASGHMTKTPGLVMERFLQCSDEKLSVNRCIKTIARPKSVKWFEVHHCHLSEGKRYIDPLQREVKKAIHAFSSHETIQINHYYTKSKEEWDLKRVRGRATKQADDPEKYRKDVEFYNHDLSADVDTKILRYLEPTREEMHRIENLPGFSGRLRLKKKGEVTGHVDRADSQGVSGWAKYREANDPVPLELMINGKSVAHTIASHFRHDLKEKGMGDGFSGFRFPIHASYGLKGGEFVAVRWYHGTHAALPGSPRIFSMKKAA